MRLTSPVCLLRAQPAMTRDGRLAAVFGIALALLLAAACAVREEALESTSLSTAGLSPEAAKIVNHVTTQNELASLCAGGMDSVKSQVQRATVKLLFSGQIDQPRTSGTEAGKHIATYCKKTAPDAFESSPTSERRDDGLDGPA